MSGMVLIRGARQLITLRGPRTPRRGAAAGELGIIRDGAVLIEDGRIVEVGPSRRVENLSQARRAHEVDAAGCVVMPGFVDCHTHIVSGIPWPKNYDSYGIAGDDRDSGSVSQSGMSAKRLELRARHLIDGLIRHGTTTLEARSGYGVDETTELKIMKVQANLHRAPLDVIPTFMSPRTIPPRFDGDACAYMSWLCDEFMPKIQKRRLARFADFCCDGNVFQVNEGNCYLETVRQVGLQLKIYAGQRGADQAVRLAVALDAISIHNLEHAPPKDVELLARSNTIAVLLPGSSFYTGPQYDAPARRLIDAGVAVAAATNFNAARNPAYNMQTIVALSCAHMGMSPAEAICATTFNAAWAIGYGHETGSLETGKWGDAIVLNVSDYREIPRHFGVNLVKATVKRGMVICNTARIARSD